MTIHVLLTQMKKNAIWTLDAGCFLHQIACIPYQSFSKLKVNTRSTGQQQNCFQTLNFLIRCILIVPMELILIMEITLRRSGYRGK
nr:hypothetical protein Iba_chr08dCG1930 [Ipomoea batatas]